MVIDSRTGESGNIPFRSGRFYNVDSKWYFSSREQSNIGPFQNKDEANDALTVYLKDVTTLKGLILAS
ncbi:MAG: DUF6316 family protein [Thiohalomonadales bacterium]